MVIVSLSLILSKSCFDDIPPETRFPNLSQKFRREGNRLRKLCKNFVGRRLQLNEISALEKTLKLREPKPLDEITPSWLVILPRPISIPGLKDIFMVEGISNACLFHSKKPIAGVSGDEGKAFLTGKWTIRPDAYYSGRYLLWEHVKERTLTIEERLFLAYYFGFSSKPQKEPSLPTTLVRFSNGASKATINDLGAITVNGMKGQLQYTEWAQISKFFNLLRK